MTVTLHREGVLEACGDEAPHTSETILLDDSEWSAIVLQHRALSVVNECKVH